MPALSAHRASEGKLLSFTKLSTKYVGRIADDYESVRTGKKWDSENESIAQLLTYVEQGSRTLDSPVGTGRLFPYFAERNFEIYGLDVSSDMIAKARANAKKLGTKVRVEKGDIRSIPYPDGFFDLVVCLRFLNMIDERGLEVVLRELTRTSRDKLLIGIRYVTPLSDMRARPSDWARLLARPIRMLRRIAHIFIGRRWDGMAHEKTFLMQLLADLRLQVLQTRYVERRWDNTDYVLLLLAKETARD